MTFSSGAELKNKSPDSVPGSQAIRRAFQVLRSVAEADRGRRLADLASDLGLPVPTTHRILQALMREGMVEQVPGGRSYRLGNGFVQIADASRRTSLQERLGPVLRATAESLGCSVFLSVRLGAEMLCIERATGRQPIQIVPYDVGERRPLGIGAAGIALLAQEPAQRARTIMKRHAAAYARHNLTVEDIDRMVTACRDCGYSYNPGHFIEGVAGLGIVIRDPLTQTIAAVNVAILAPRLAHAADREALAARLIREVSAALNQ
ncbi:IclR family transcriptional regulator [Bosea sp. (in: a-proteobacteria)]|jgi:DNA-binding IclR family transcriptional regulator|uniref:IclR family transcriptional regulator n=1 Tax=Bosea sp. (in: a-proteobacteria) TaxID=1871050 RepID=UPI003F727D9F